MLRWLFISSLFFVFFAPAVAASLLVWITLRRQQRPLWHRGIATIFSGILSFGICYVLLGRMLSSRLDTLYLMERCGPIVGYRVARGELDGSTLTPPCTMPCMMPEWD